MNFPENWFHQANQNKLKEFILNYSPKKCNRSRATEGQSIVYMAECVKDFGKIYAIDT